jgi:hypothetical protein
MSASDRTGTKWRRRFVAYGAFRSATGALAGRTSFATASSEQLRPVGGGAFVVAVPPEPDVSEGIFTPASTVM